MNAGPLLCVLLRTALAYAAGICLLFYAPDIWLKAVAPVSGLVVNTVCPFLIEMRVYAQDAMVFAEGKIRLAMMLADGQPLPLTPGSWNKHGVQTVSILVVAGAVWAAQASRVRKAVWAFPFMLMAAAAASGFDLAVEIVHVTLASMGTGWLAGLPLAPSGENLDVFHGVERWFNASAAIKAFNDGGGRLFYGLLSGLICYAVPVPRRFQGPGEKDEK